ncbi:hypothetical protein BB559_001504 [Furculomyces boomerangus]|uniref:proline--tRNA ligase n=2 Tax=Harpellales TaxID=61421 RepID=A0A2T9Z1Q0_9FUNG|nr:hypothetical protein BB559_001504 [Furculomyces boomerangus]PWA01706.1 hypothetical protein BB558_002181 [Smittium angustum]
MFSIFRTTLANPRSLARNVHSIPITKLIIPEYNQMSSVFLPTQKLSPLQSSSKTPTGDLLTRAGYIRQSSSGTFTLLPIGQRVIEKISAIIDSEMKNIGAQRLTMPSLLLTPAWKKSKRFQRLGDELFKLSDRKGTEYILGPTYEEEITSIIANEILSYRKLPLRLYQISNKFRDEMRPRNVLLRGREFLMKDLYTFDVSEEAALKSYQLVRSAYNSIFKRIGVPYAVAEADSGDIGGSLSHEFHIISPDGEDTLLHCKSCRTVANEEKARGIIENPKKLSTEQLFTFFDQNHNLSLELNIAVYISSEPISNNSNTNNNNSRTINLFILPPGRHLNPAKSKSAVGDAESLGSELYSEESTQSFTKIIEKIDTLVNENTNMKRLTKPYNFNIIIDNQCIDKTENLSTKTTNDHSLVFKTDDIIKIEPNDKCESCNSKSIDSKLVSSRAIEIGHIFYLGTKYSSVLDANFSSNNNSLNPIQMGCYGIGIMRTMQAAADAVRDNEGLVWPVSISPYSLGILPLLPPKIFPEKNETNTFTDLLKSNNEKTNVLINGINKIVSSLVAEERLSTKETENEPFLSNTSMFDHHNIVLDDRFSLPNGYRLYDSELLGLPFVVILGNDFFNSNGKKVELRIRKFKNDQNNDYIIRNVDLEDLPKIIFKNL